MSLGGIPPAAGFLAKWKIFEVLADRMQGGDTTWFLFLTIMLIVTSVVGLAYYLRVVVAMYMTPAPDDAPETSKPAFLSLGLVIICAALTLWLGFGFTIFGLGPEGLLSWVQQVTH